MALWNRKTLEHRWLPTDNVLQTDRIRLVEVTPELIPGYLELLDDDFLAVHSWPESILRHTKQGLRAGRRTRHTLTRDTALVVASNAPDIVMGFVSVEQLGIANEPWQIRLQIGSQYRKQGIATNLLPALSDHLALVDGYYQVSLTASCDNVAMTRVCDKLGYEHTEVQYRYPDGTVETAQSYILLPR